MSRLRRTKSPYSPLTPQLDGCGTLVEQLVRALRQEIQRLPLGARMPPTRLLASDLGVARNTVMAAYSELTNEGLITAHFGGGSSVSQKGETSLAPAVVNEAPSGLAAARLSSFAERLRAMDSSPILERPELEFDFRYGLPVVADFPFGAWSRIVGRRAAVATTPVLGYGEAAGYRPLRVEIAEYLRRARGIACSADQIVITTGSQQALDLASRILIDPGDRVALEEPAYEGARQTFAAAGARILTVPVDDEGLQVSALPRRGAACRVLYVTPSHQFPTGAVLSASRRAHLLDWARSTGCYVIEDDYDGELRYDIRNIEAIKGRDAEDRVIYVGTLSKVLFPSMRLGYLVSPRALLGSFVAAKRVTDRQTPALLQMSLADFMAQGLFNRHLQRAKRICAQRRNALLSALDQHLGSAVRVQGANAGIHVMLWINQRAAHEVPALIERAAQAGVGIYPISPYYHRAPSGAGLLLGYASMDERQIVEGVRRLARVLTASVPPDSRPRRRR